MIFRRSSTKLTRAQASFERRKRSQPGFFAPAVSGHSRFIDHDSPDITSDPLLDFAWLHAIRKADPDTSHCPQLGIPFSDLPMCQ